MGTFLKSFDTGAGLRVVVRVETCYTPSPRRGCFAVPDDNLERIRSLLAHAHDREKVNPFPAQNDPTRTSYAVSSDEIERLRSLLAHAHDHEVNVFRKLVLRIRERFTPPVNQPQQQPERDKEAA
jgi:hypothetical protein